MHYQCKFPQKPYEVILIFFEELNTFEKFKSQDNSSGVTFHQIHFRKTENLRDLDMNRKQRNIPIYILFTDSNKQNQ